jgi:hypothetical protein
VLFRSADALSGRAADEIARQIGAGWEGYRTLHLDGAPPDGDCAGKAYAAIVRTTASPESTTGPVDVGLQLSDCADWPVDEWYVTAAATPDAVAGAESGALSLIVRLRTWMSDHPARARALFERGLAYAPGAPPTYLYTLFKTTDGQMRAYVRPGGPAFVAGLRTNDIVEKIDGRFWWEYGTYTTERIAYDDKPHAFEVTRGANTVDVRLAAPYSEE